MKIDFTQELKGINGDVLKNPDEKPFLLKDVCITSLDAVFDDERKIEAKEKYRRGALAQKIYNSQEQMDISIDEIKLIKDLVGKAYAPHIVYVVWDILDPPPAK